MTTTEAYEPSAHEKPILRVSHGGEQFLSVADLLDENVGWEFQAWIWIEVMRDARYYDDSDLKEGVVVVYYSRDKQALQEQMDEFERRYPRRMGRDPSRMYPAPPPASLDAFWAACPSSEE
jgi:hypothetical protein